MQLSHQGTLNEKSDAIANDDTGNKVGCVVDT